MKPLSACRLSVLWLLPVVLGCGTPAAEPSGAEPVHLVSHFDPQSAGTIRGRVSWTGDVPLVAPFFVVSEETKDKTYMPNANAPVVDAGTRGVANAVLFLRGVEAEKARPWDPPAVTVEQRWQHLRVLQGDSVSHLGFVRRGQTVGMISRDPFYHSLHADGAAFFTLTFPELNQTRRRPLDKTGLVELSSA